MASSVTKRRGYRESVMGSSSGQFSCHLVRCSLSSAAKPCALAYFLTRMHPYLLLKFLNMTKLASASSCASWGASLKA